MKTLAPALAAHVALQSTTLAHALRITRGDGTVFAFTSAAEDVLIGGTLYRAAPGLDISSLEQTAGMAVGNLELTTLDDGSTFARADVLAGVWRNAAFVLLRYNATAPDDGLDTLMTGTLGEIELRQTTLVVELRGLQQYLQQPVGSISSKTCRARLGDALCGVNLVGYTFTGTVTAVANQQVFTDSARAQAAGYFDDGILTFTSGPLAGQRQKIKTFAAGVFTLSLPMLQAITVGTTYSAIAGCRKRLPEDCVAKFGNAINFQGEPHLPGIDAVTKAP